MEEEENAFYIHSTYRGGTWQKQEDGSWKLLKEPDIFSRQCKVPLPMWGKAA